MTTDAREAADGAHLVTEVLVASASDPTLLQHVRAVIDTESDISAVPSEFIRENRLVPALDREIVLADGRTVEQPLYHVEIVLPSWQPVVLLAWAAPFETALIGLDVLQHGLFVLDGPRARFRLLWRTSWRARLLRAINRV